jgi:hypothetical protein
LPSVFVASFFVAAMHDPRFGEAGAYGPGDLVIMISVHHGNALAVSSFIFLALQFDFRGGLSI